MRTISLTSWGSRLGRERRWRGEGERFGGRRMGGLSLRGVGRSSLGKPRWRLEIRWCYLARCFKIHEYFDAHPSFRLKVRSEGF
jgi:hypothetical protein